MIGKRATTTILLVLSIAIIFIFFPKIFFQNLTLSFILTLSVVLILVRHINFDSIDESTVNLGFYEFIVNKKSSKTVAFLISIAITVILTQFIYPKFQKYTLLLELNPVNADLNIKPEKISLKINNTILSHKKEYEIHKNGINPIFAISLVSVFHGDNIPIKIRIWDKDFEFSYNETIKLPFYSFLAYKKKFELSKVPNLKCLSLREEINLLIEQFDEARKEQDISKLKNILEYGNKLIYNISLTDINECELSNTKTQWKQIEKLITSIL